VPDKNGSVAGPRIRRARDLLFQRPRSTGPGADGSANNHAEYCHAATLDLPEHSTLSTMARRSGSASRCAPPGPKVSSIRACRISVANARHFSTQTWPATREGRHLDYHWNGARVDYYREVTSGAVVRIDQTG
jgi:hypothetical protein